MNEYTAYISPFSWRYGTEEIRQIWSLEGTRLLWRKLWVALAEVEVDYGLVEKDQVEELIKNQSNLDLGRSLEIEEQIEHDLMAELKLFAEQCPSGGKILHLGATSMDIKDNTSILQQKASLVVLLDKTRNLLSLLSEMIQETADLPLIAFTHLQPAEPSTLGYRLSQTGQDLLSIHNQLEQFSKEIRAKGFTGAVGSSASFTTLIGEKNLPTFQRKLAKKLDLTFFDVVNQTYPRLQDFQLLSLLAGLSAVLYKFAFDLRILQSPPFGEMAEPFGDQQVGSSAMPFKKNPIKAEKINSLGRYLAQLPRIAWDNTAHSLLERTLDDSANRRIILPEAFLCADELIETCKDIVIGLEINQNRIDKNLADYAPFAATEQLLMALVKAGADRQKMHGLIREHSLQAWSEIQLGNPNPLMDTLSSDEVVLNYLPKSTVQDILSATASLGDVVTRSRGMASKIKKQINN
jgi:adenylosuccinate lyase